MTTMSTPYATTHPSYADDDTLRLPPATFPTADRRPAAPVLDATRLWTGGLATAAVAALVGLVGTLGSSSSTHRSGSPPPARSARATPPCSASSPPSPRSPPPGSRTC
jgi:hypothetical protein